MVSSNINISNENTGSGRDKPSVVRIRRYQNDSQGCMNDYNILDGNHSGTELPDNTSI